MTAIWLGLRGETVYRRYLFLRILRFRFCGPEPFDAKLDAVISDSGFRRL